VVLNVQKIVGKAVARSEIIDGQQRLTTLQLFIAALRDYATANKSEHANRLKRLTVNEDEKPNSESSFKVWPTNADRTMFRSIMTAGSPDALLKEHDLSSKAELPRLIGAYCYFYGQIHSFAIRGGSELEAVDRQLFALTQALRAGLQLIVIELEENDDPQVIFETLNARGQPLLPSDLIRNTIFHQAASDAVHIIDERYADELYARYWHPFDNDRILVAVNGEDRYWHVEERQGRLSRPRIDLFIFHFLVMQTGKELAIGHIFQEFREWRDASRAPLEVFLQEMKHYSSIFRGLISPVGNDRPSEFARRLRSLDTSTVYPFLLYIIGLSTGRLSKQDRDQIVSEIESWLIRRLICQLTNKNYNKFFVSLLTKVKQAEKDQLLADEGDAAKVSAAIKRAVHEELTRGNDVTTRWPDDDEFEKGWLDKIVYVRSRPDRAVMLLKAIDAEMSTTKTERIILPEDLTVEHILPQNGALADYPYPEPNGETENEAPSVRRSRLIHTMGNLTLLTGPLNSSVSNGPFSKKRPAIAEHSALRLNARFQAHQDSAWSELEITTRGRDLFGFAKAIWPRSETSAHSD
jgi:hypothetical protein